MDSDKPVLPRFRMSVWNVVVEFLMESSVCCCKGRRSTQSGYQRRVTYADIIGQQRSDKAAVHVFDMQKITTARSILTMNPSKEYIIHAYPHGVIGVKAKFWQSLFEAA